MCNGMTFAVFRESGKVPELKEQLIRDARICAIRGTEILARVGSMPSVSTMGTFYSFGD